MGGETDELGEGEPSCGPNPHSVEIATVAGNPLLRLTSDYSSEGCADNVWVTLADFTTYGALDLNQGFAIPLTPDTSICFEETGVLSDAAQHGWGPYYDKIALSIVDVDGNTLVYVLQRYGGAEPITGPSYREIFLDPDAGSYCRDLFADFSLLPEFAAEDAAIGAIVFEIDEHGWATLDNLTIGDPGETPDSSASVPTFRGLDLLPGSAWCIATALSADGRVVIGYDAHQGTPVYWDESTGVTALPLGIDDGLAQTRALALSADGSVVVGTCPSEVFGSARTGEQEAFSWTEAEGLVRLEYPAGVDAVWAAALGVSADGSCVAGAFSDQQGRGHAFEWTNDNGMDILTTPSDTQVSEATAVSLDGYVVAGWRTAGNTSSAASTEAFRWTRVDGLNDLGILTDDAESEATAASGDGTVIVGVSRSAAATDDGAYSEAFLWEQLDGLSGLGILPGYVNSRANAVSADGSVVVGSCFTEDYELSVDRVAGDAEAFIWDAERGMRTLTNVLAEDYDVNLTGWRLFEAVGISADGCTIVGNGINPDGDVEPWMAIMASDAMPLGLAIVNPNLPASTVSGDGTQITLRIALTNQGETAIEKGRTVDLIIKARPVSPGPDRRITVLSDQPVGNLKPGKSKTITAKLSLPAGMATDDYILVVQMNSVEVTTPVDQPIHVEYGRVELAGAFTNNTLPASVVAGAAIKGAVSVTLKNEGNITVAKGETVDIRILLQAQQSREEHELAVVRNYAIGNLKPGKTKTVKANINLTGGLPQGAYQLTAVVEADDPDLSIASIAGDAMTIGPSSIDLRAVVTSPKIPNSIEAGSSTKITLPVTIWNDGNVAVPAGQSIDITVHLRRVGQQQRIQVTTLSDQAIGNLQPGKSKKTSITSTLPVAVPAGDYEIIVTIDATNAVSESNETNNTLVLEDTVTVKAAPPSPPDLTVASTNLPERVESGTFLYLTTVIENLGTGTSTSTWVEFYLSTNAKLDDDDYFLDMDYVPEIGGGQSASISSRLSLPAVVMERIKLYIIVVVDPFDDCEEGGQGNKNNILAESAIFTAIGY